MAKHYHITKVTRFRDRGAWVTVERTIKYNATIEDVVDLAGKRGADIDEVIEELDVYGITISSIKGYYITEER